MANDGQFADVRDAVLACLTGYAPLSAWMTARGGHYYLARSTDRLPILLSRTECPGIILKPQSTPKSRATNVYFKAWVRSLLILTSDKRESNELDDLEWHVSRCLEIEAAEKPPLDLSYVYDIQVGTGERTAAHEDPALYGEGLMWFETVPVSVVMRYDPTTA